MRDVKNQRTEIFRNGRAFSLVGGGDSVAFVKQNGYAEKVSYVSTGGGAMLESLDSIPKPQIGGHIHPGVTLIAQNRQKLKFPCYLVSENQIILPAFSQFTGLDTNFEKKQSSTFKKYIITAEKLIEWVVLKKVDSLIIQI